LGEYKEYPNHVELPGGEMFYYASPLDTPIKMGELMEWFRHESKKAELHPVEISALFHYEFVLIHPFDDGNGRVSRLLQNYVLMRAGLPPIVIKSIDKQDYLAALHRADAGDMEAFVNYSGEQLLWSLEVSLKAAHGESLDEPGDLEKRVELLKRKFKLSAKKVVTKKSPEVMLGLFNNSILPLAKSWLETLNKFDSFFYSRTESVTLDGREYADFSVLSTSAPNSVIVEKLFNQSVGMITLRSRPKGLRPLKMDMTLNGGSVEFWFYEYAYQIGSPEAKVFLEKEYDEQLTLEEIQQLVQGLGNYLLDVIETETRKK
jgi:hypothetical protein